MSGGAVAGRGGRSTAIAIDISQEFPAWVRECDKDFKEKSCTLTHEGRTLKKWRAFVGRLEKQESNPFRRAARHRCRACQAATVVSGRSKKLQHHYSKPSMTVLNETKGCTCHEDLCSFLPGIDTMFVPSELLAPFKHANGGQGQRKRSRQEAASSRSSQVKLEPGLDESEAAENIFGTEGYDPNAAQKGEAEEGEGGVEKEGKEDGEARRPGQDGDDDDEPEEEEDLELDDYENAGGACDDDDEMGDNEKGGGSDDEEARYGTF